MATSGNKSIQLCTPKQHTLVCTPIPMDLLKRDLAFKNMLIRKMRQKISHQGESCQHHLSFLLNSMEHQVDGFAN